MKLSNKSSYDTQALRKVIGFALKSWWKGTGKRQIYVEVISNRTYKSHAWLNGNSMRINLWLRDLSDDLNKKKLAWVIRHEIEHLNGKNHRDMIGSYFLHWPKEHKELDNWILQFNIPLKQIKEVVKTDVKEVRYNKVRALLERWQYKLKVASNKVKSYQAKTRRYEVIFAKGKEQNGL